MQRLFAIDMKNVMAGRLEIAWVYNFERLNYDEDPNSRKTHQEVSSMFEENS